MSTLQDIIEAHAAVRLRLSPGRRAVDDLGQYQAFLKVEYHRLKMRHRAGARGREVCQARATIVDVLLRHLWITARGTLSAQAQQDFPPLALVGVGGYGRGELSPHSDIDIMLLHEGQVVVGTKPLPGLQALMDGIYYPLIDLGCKVSQCVRTVGECVQVGNEDMQTKTSLIEARFITGDRKLFEKLERAVLHRCVEGHEDQYILARLQDQTVRRAKFGDSATMQEPNIKNGCGGLRDFQNLVWMAFFRYRVRSLEEMEKREFIAGSERKQLEAAYDFLLTVRNEMHFLTNKASEVLTKAMQPTVATHLGYSDRSPSRRLEKFMRDLYVHLRNIYLITRTIEDRLALQPRKSRLPDLRKLLGVAFRKKEQPTTDGFYFLGGQILQANNQVFRSTPRFMRVFLHAQQRGLKFHPDLSGLIRREIPSLKRDFLHDEHVRDSFLEILNQRGAVAPILRAMHEVGLLGKYLPEFGKLTCLVQHEFYHQYAADEHTLQCLSQLDRVWEASALPYRLYTELLQNLERPFILYLALLLHDAGKATHTGDHAAVGGQLALRVAKRLGLDGATTHTLRLLIEHHLDMAMISQRRDLEDHQVIRNFAAIVQTRENLHMLTLHTFADSLATSDKLWNGFKESLLWQLHDRTLQVLQGGTDFIRVEEKQRELLADEVFRLAPKSFSGDEIAAHFATLPQRYFNIHTAKDVLNDLTLAHRFMHQQIAVGITGNQALEPVIHWQNEPDRACTIAKVCTWDRNGLFSTITGSFAAAGLSILSAQVFTRNDGIVLDSFTVTEAHSGGVVPKANREDFAKILTDALTGQSVDLTAMIGRHRTQPTYQPHDGESIPTRVYFENDASAHRTILEIETADHLGLLHEISKVLFELGLNIGLAKILTEKGAAVDTFYITEADGQKVEGARRQQHISERLLSAISRMGN